jgi:hypothetical protein
VSESRLTIWQRTVIRLSSFLFFLLIIIWVPFFYLYGRVVCLLAWLMWVSPTRNIIVVCNGLPEADEIVAELLPSLKDRAVFLDFKKRKNWGVSISGELFRCFGPAPATQFLMPNYLPSVVVIERFRKPVHFSLGHECGNRASALASLQRLLAEK